MVARVIFLAVSTSIVLVTNRGAWPLCAFLLVAGVWTLGQAAQKVTGCDKGIVVSRPLTRDECIPWRDASQPQVQMPTSLGGRVEVTLMRAGGGSPIYLHALCGDFVDLQGVGYQLPHILDKLWSFAPDDRLDRR